MNTDIIYRYLPEKGPRSPFVVGVPARDIAEHEVFADPDLQAAIEANIATTGAIYEKVEPKKTGKAAKVDKPEPVEGSTG